MNVMDAWMSKEPLDWSALDISRAYAELEKKAKDKKEDGGGPRCICGERLIRVDGSLECWRCYPSDD